MDMNTAFLFESFVYRMGICPLCHLWDWQEDQTQCQRLFPRILHKRPKIAPGPIVPFPPSRPINSLLRPRSTSLYTNEQLVWNYT